MNEWSEAEQHVERAHDLYEAGQWAEAEKALRKALSLNPFRPEWHFNLGLTLDAAGRFEDAISALETAHELLPGDGPTLTLLGAVCVRAGRAAEGLVWLEKAEELDEVRAEALVRRIDALSALGRFEDAEVAFYRALQEEEGEDAQAYAAMGESLLDRGEGERALFCLREAATLDSEMPRIKARLASAYAATGRYERARQLYLKELRENPGDVGTLLDLGYLLVDMNRLSEGAEKFRRVLELETDNADAHFYLGDIALRQQRSRDAEASFRLVQRLEPGYPEVKRRLAELALDRGDLVDARRLLRREVRSLGERPEDFRADDLDDLGQLLLDARLFRDAARVFERLTELESARAEAWHYLSVARFSFGERAAAEDACRSALQIDPNLVPALHNMALSAIHDRRWTRASHYIDRIRGVDPDDASLRRLKLMLRLWRSLDVLGGLLRRARERSLGTRRRGSARVEVKPGVDVSDGGGESLRVEAKGEGERAESE